MMHVGPMGRDERKDPAAVLTRRWGVRSAVRPPLDLQNYDYEMTHNGTETGQDG